MVTGAARGGRLAFVEAAEGGRIKLEVEELSPGVLVPEVLLADPFEDDESTRCRGAIGAGNRRTAGNAFTLAGGLPPIELVDDEEESDVERSGRERGGGRVDDVDLASEEETVADIERFNVGGLLPPNALDEVCDDERLDLDSGGFDAVDEMGRLKEVEGNREVEAKLASPGRASLLLNPTFGLSTTVELADATEAVATGLIGAALAEIGLTVDFSSAAGLTFGTSFTPNDFPLEVLSGFATSPLLLFSPRFNVETVVARLEVKVLSCRLAVGAASAGGFCSFLRLSEVATGVEEEALGVLSTIVAVEEAELTVKGAREVAGVAGDRMDVVDC